MDVRSRGAAQLGYIAQQPARLRGRAAQRRRAGLRGEGRKDEGERRTVLSQKRGVTRSRRETRRRPRVRHVATGARPEARYSYCNTSMGTARVRYKTANSAKHHLSCWIARFADGGATARVYRRQSPVGRGEYGAPLGRGETRGARSLPALALDPLQHMVRPGGTVRILEVCEVYVSVLTL